MRSLIRSLGLIVASLSLSIASWFAVGSAAEPAALEIGDRLNLFVDDYLIERSDSVHLELHKPIAREVVLVHDAPWEGNTCAYHVVDRDGDLYRMWYRGSHYEVKTRKMRHDEEVACYAESEDGIHWTRPELGLVEFEGSKRNNIFWTQKMTRHEPGVLPPDMPPIPFRDSNPAAHESERFKAMSGTNEAGLYGWTSPDGIHWKQIGQGTILREEFYIDYTQSAFWDVSRGKYVAYLRDWWPGGIGGDATGNVRAIRFVTSDDFRNWSQPERIQLDVELTRSEQLYTNQIRPYDRAPHIYLGFPMRYTHGRSDDSTNDGLLLSGRGGVRFKLWREAIIRPGLQVDRWMTRNNLTGLGVVETEAAIEGMPPELSIYSSEGYLGGPDGHGASCRLRRFTYRMDGFVSIQASPEGGEFVTKPLKFRGRELVLNFSTSGAGDIQVEIQDEEGKPIDGYTLSDSPRVYGDNIEYVMRWQKRGGKKGQYTSDVSRLAAKPVRLRFVMKEADLFSLRFREQGPAEPRYTGFAIPGSNFVRK